MATHHVSLRRFCPNPFGPLTPSRRGVVSSETAAQAERTSSKVRYCFYPWERLTTEPPKNSGIGKVQESHQLFSHKQAEPVMNGTSQAKAMHCKRAS
jgi:hypothetical protein